MLLHRLHRCLAGGLIIFAIAYIIAEIGMKSPRNLISLAGTIVFVLITFVFSKHPAEVRPLPYNLILICYKSSDLAT